VLPAQDVVNLSINGEDQGTFGYTSYTPSGDDRFVTFHATGSGAQFDYAEVRVVAP
jgi:hypothetical protein